MSGDILIELIDTLGNFTQNIELMLLNFSPGFNYMMVGFFFVSVISLVFWIITKSTNFIVIGAK